MARVQVVVAKSEMVAFQARQMMTGNRKSLHDDSCICIALHTSAGAEASRCVTPKCTSPSPGIGSTEGSCVTSESYM